MAALPVPNVVYVYDDLPYLSPPIAERERWHALLGELRALLLVQPRVRFLEVEPQVAALAARRARGPYARTLAIGAAGRRVADLLHARTGWFPAIVDLPLTRIELPAGGYAVMWRPPIDLGAFAAALTPVAVVDDTIYAGQTLRWVLDRLPAETPADVFCLQGAGITLAVLRRRCHIHAGIELAGERERDFTVIKASHLFEPGAIHAEQAELAFYERRAWMDAWFGDEAVPIITLCARLRALTPVSYL